MEDIYKHKPRLGILDIFDSAQRSKKAHGRLITKLFNIYKTNSANDFITEYIQCLCIAFCGEKGPFVEVALNFGSNYFAYHAAQNSEQDRFVLCVYKFLFKDHAGDQQMRLRKCEFINKVLSAMGDGATIDDEIFEMLADAMLDRLQDKLPSVRAQAVMALRRLQEPHEKDCSIIKALTYHLKHDPSHEVRAKVLSLIAVSQKTLPAILTRIHDKNDTVRKEFYRTVSRLKLVRFTLKKRQEIMDFGFRDRSQSVRDFVVEHLVTSWFEQWQNNHIKFLSCFDVETFGETKKKLLFCIFKQQSTCELIDMMRSQQMKDRKVIAIENLTPESAVLWQCLVAFLTSPPPECEVDEDEVTKILPELTHFTNYIKEYMMTSTHKINQKLFIVGQLLEICNMYCLSDEMGRKQLKNLCIEMLISDEIDCSLVPVLIRVLNCTIPCVKTRIAAVAEVISDIRDPLHAEVTNMDIEKDVELMKNKMSKLNNSKIEAFNEEESESRNDPETLIKCLTILRETLKARDVLILDEVLLTLKDRFISQCNQDKNIKVLSLSVNVLDLMCLRSLSLAKEMFYKFFLLIYEGLLQIPPLQAVFNILANYGFEAFPLQVDFNMSHGKGDCTWPTIQDFMKDESLPSLYIKHVVAQLSSFLESNEPEVKIETCQGFIKLFVAGRLSSPIVLTQLILLWYSSSTECEPLIRQPLGLFFANCSLYCPNIPEVICKSVIKVIEVLFNLSSACTNYLSIEVEPVVNMLISLVRHDTLQPPENVSKSGASYHLVIAEMMCDEIIVRRINASIFMRTIQKLTVIPGDGKHALPLIEKLKKVMLITKKKDKKVHNTFVSFHQKLTTLINKSEGGFVNESAVEESAVNLSDNDSMSGMRSDVQVTIKEETLKMEIPESDSDSSISKIDNGLTGNEAHDSDHSKIVKSFRKIELFPDFNSDCKSDSDVSICANKKARSNDADISDIMLLDDISPDQKDSENTVPDHKKLIVPDSESDAEFLSVDQIIKPEEFNNLVTTTKSISSEGCFTGSSVKTRRQCSKAQTESSSESSNVRELRSATKRIRETRTTKKTTQKNH